jgi:hypothetical protein
VHCMPSCRSHPWHWSASVWRNAVSANGLQGTLSAICRGSWRTMKLRSALLVEPVIALPEVDLMCGVGVIVQGLRRALCHAVCLVLLTALVVNPAVRAHTKPSAQQAYAAQCSHPDRFCHAPLVFRTELGEVHNTVVPARVGNCVLCKNINMSSRPRVRCSRSCRLLTSSAQRNLARRGCVLRACAATSSSPSSSRMGHTPQATRCCMSGRRGSGGARGAASAWRRRAPQAARGAPAGSATFSHMVTTAVATPVSCRVGSTLSSS